MSVRVRIACFARGHVLGPDQALDQFELAVVADGGDAPGDGDILAPVDRAGLDLVEGRLAGIDQLFGPVLVVHVGEFVVAGPQAFDLGLLLVRRLGRLRTHPPEARGGAPVHVEPCLGPFPACLQFPRRRLEAVQGELVQQIGIVEPDPPLVLLSEQVAVDLAACRLVSLEADETRDGGGGRNPVLGQQALDLPGAGPVALLAHRRPDRVLARMIRGDGEGHQCVQIDFARTVGLKQHRCGIAEPQAFLHGALRDPEARRDGACRAARIGQAAECLDLIGRVHGGADTVLGQRNLFGRHDASDHAAGHGVVPRPACLRRPAPASRPAAVRRRSPRSARDQPDLVPWRGQSGFRAARGLRSALSSVKAESSAGVLRTLSGESSSWDSGMSEISRSGSCISVSGIA